MEQLVHLFKFKDKYLALDVVSNSLLELDAISYQVLNLYMKNLSAEQITSILSDEKIITSIEEVIEIINEIKQLEQDKVLFNKDIIPEKSLFGDESIIKAMCLHVAHDCNLRCKYCFASSGHFGGKRRLLDIETGKAAIDFLIKSAKNRKHLEIDFFGGEPLMNMDVVKELVTYSKEQGLKHNKIIKLTLTTNGLLLTGEVRDYLNKENISLVLSLDGRKEINDNMRYTLDGTSSYDVIVPNIKDTVETRNNDNYYVRGTYTSENVDFAADVKHMRDLGFYYISVEPVVAPEDMRYALTKEHIEQIQIEYEKLADEYLGSLGTEREFSFFHFNIDLENGPCVAKRLSGCGAGHHYIAVTPEGDIYPCHQFVGREEFVLGNVKDGINRIDLMNTFKDTNIYSKAECKKCWARFMCAGGCHANAYGFNNDINDPYVIACEITKKRLEAALYIKAIQMHGNNI